MHEIAWISFDHTVPVPVLRDGFLISRDDVDLLFITPENEIRWEKDCVWIQWLDGGEWDYAEADRLERAEVEGVEFFRVGTAPFQFNDDTEQMAELGYTTFFVPGGGIVVNTPDPQPWVAAKRIMDDLWRIIGVYAPERVNSWAEYASVVPSLDRVFAFAGVDRHEKEKQAAVGDLVEIWLSTRALAADTTGTARADELAVGDVMEAADVRWWSHSPARVLYTVSAIEPAEDGKLSVSFTSENDRDRTLTVSADRRFLRA